MIFPNTDDGKVQAIAYCNDRLDAIRPRLLQAAFKPLADLQVSEVRRGCRPPPKPVRPPRSARGLALDGSRLGIARRIRIDSAEWPKWSLLSTVPRRPAGASAGRWPALSNASSPIRKTIGFSGYAEGWAPYAEQLADEIGIHDDDPMGRDRLPQIPAVPRRPLQHRRHRYPPPGLEPRKGDPAPSSTWKAMHRALRRARWSAIAPRRTGLQLQARPHRVDQGRASGRKPRSAPATTSRTSHEAGLNCGRVPLDVLDFGVIDAYVKGADVSAA